MILPKIVETEKQRFFALRGKGPFETCGPLFRKLTELAKDADLFQSDINKTAMLVLCHVPTTAQEDLEWACAIRVSSTQETVDGLEEIVIPGMRYATAIHKGGYEGLRSSWGDLVSKWIPEQAKLEILTGSVECPHYEVYLNDCSNGTKEEDLETQLFCPVSETSAATS